MKRPGQKNLYRQALSRSDSTLLFGLARDLAIPRGGVSRAALASQEQSHFSTVSYVLKNDQGEVIRRIPLDELSNALARRCRDMRRALRQARIRPDSTRPLWLNPQLLKGRPRWFPALVWAISTGEPYPRPGYPLLETCITVGLLLCGVIPGLIYLVLRSQRRKPSLQALVALENHWRAIGAPQPNGDFMRLALTQTATRSSS